MDHAHPTIRPAAPAELALLQALLLRSKASWGYDESFMWAARAELSLPRGYLERNTVSVLEDGGVQGFCSLRFDGDGAELVDLFVEPAAMGRGYGRALFEHAVATARGRGCRTLRWESDPNAEAFYLRMGARRVALRPSTVVPGRMLPLMELDLAAHQLRAPAPGSRD